MKLRASIYGLWVTASIFYSTHGLLTLHPIRDYMFPSILDVISGLLFLGAGAILISAITHSTGLICNSARISASLGATLFLLFACIFVYVFRGLFSLPALVITAAVVVAVVGYIHLTLSLWLSRLLRLQR